MFLRKLEMHLVYHIYYGYSNTDKVNMFAGNMLTYV